TFFHTQASLNQFADVNLLKEKFHNIIQQSPKDNNMIWEATDHTRFAISIVSESNTILYYILVMEKNVALTESMLDDLAIFNNAVNIYYHMKEKTDIEFQFMHEYFLVKLIEGADDKHSLYQRIQLLNIPLKKYFFMIVINAPYDQSISRIRLRQYAQELQPLFPGISAIYKNLIVLLYITDKSVISDYTMTSFRRQLSRLNLRAGISNYYEDLSASKRSFRQALDAIARGEIARPEENVYQFSRLLPYRLLGSLPSFTSLEDCIAPCVKVLIDYDRENKSDFINTLRVYVKNVCHATNTAKELNMHRNTLVYRIKKIEEITGIDFSNGDALLNIMLSFKALDLIESGQNQSPQKKK
ncbi:MAG: helix-turn-helix domain-containing protein, partial [Clostridiales bacterium]|nr:helix-turn-helix domain-containing protein [Clostridiales bacterium]